MVHRFDRSGSTRIVGELPTTGLANSLWRDIKVVGHHMVVVSETINSKLQVFDLTRLLDFTSIGPAYTQHGHAGRGLFAGTQRGRP